MMKRTIAFLMTLAAIAAVTTGCPGNGPEPDERTVVKLEPAVAILEYYFAEEVDESSDMFVLSLYTNDNLGAPSLDIEFFSNEFENALTAAPDSGTYNFSDSNGKFTFENAEYYESSDDDNGTGVIGGSFVITRSGSEYTIQFDLDLPEDKVLQGNFDGTIYPFMTGGGEDVVLDFDEMDYAYAQASEMPEHEGMWNISFEGETDSGSEMELLLAINAEAGLTELPTGNFPMATEIRKGVTGTAEPTSLLIGDDGQAIGCTYTSYSADTGYALYSVPGKGFVNITEGEEEAVYTIDFSLGLPTGKTVSGSYVGPVSHDNVDF